MASRIKRNIYIITGFMIGCVALFVFGISLYAQSSIEEQRARLEAELAQLEAEIKEQEARLDQQKKETGSISRDISILETEIKQTQAKIRQKNLKIDQLLGQISNKEETIVELEETEERQKDTLAKLIQKVRELDDRTFVELILSGQNFSEFFITFDDFTSVHRSLDESIRVIIETRDQTLTEKKQLEVQKTEEEHLKSGLASDKQKVESNKQEKNKLLQVSKSKEKTYAEILKEREKQAAEIRAALFSLRDSTAIPFGDALSYAQVASQATGVRAAYILAVLKQESNLGANVGSCYLTNSPEKGNGVGIKSGKFFENVMKATRDVDPFMELMGKLGRNPDSTPVSCPWTIGYGGAMGPSQFIPSTWEIFARRIANAVNVSVADPWNPQHAIMATAIYMKDLGADAQTYDSELHAACLYYSGARCDHPTRVNLFYGKAVTKYAAEIQENIDILQSF